MVSKIEQNIIDTFNIKFKKYDKGREYFIGNIDEMLIEMNLIINKFCETFNETKNMLFFDKINNADRYNLKLPKGKNGEIIITQDMMYKLLDHNDVSSNAQEELHEFNILKEYKRIEKNKEELNNYDRAINNICEVLIDCVKHDKINGDYTSPKNNEKIKQAGNLLYLYDRVSVMQDVLQLWVPKRYRR